MKLFLAAPESFLPSALTALGKHASRLHFLRKLLSAAPASGLPFFLVDCFACARFVRHRRADRQGRNHDSEENLFHGSLSNDVPDQRSTEQVCSRRLK